MNGSSSLINFHEVRDRDENNTFLSDKNKATRLFLG